MYANLLQRFQGAFLGCAIAETQSMLEPIVSQALLAQGNTLHFSTPAAGDTKLASFAQCLLWTLLHHDSPHDRQRALVTCPQVWADISDILAARLCGQSYPLGASSGMMLVIEQAIAQQLPLQDAAQLFCRYQGDRLAQAIALAIYCWRCTPQQFTVAVGRSQYLVQGDSTQDWITLVPALTGMMVGVSVGSHNLPSHPQFHEVELTANRLYGLWAGVSDRIAQSPDLEAIVLSQAGRFRPRRSHDLSWDREYD